MTDDRDEEFDKKLGAYFDRYSIYPRPRRTETSRNPMRWMRVLGGAALTAALAVGAVFVISARNTGSPGPSTGAAPGAVLDIKEFGLTLPLPNGIKDATYTIDASQNGQNGIVGNVIVTTPAVQRDPACASGGGIGSILVSTSQLPDSPVTAPDVKIGAYWFELNMAFNGVPCDTAQADGQQLFGQAFEDKFLSSASPTPSPVATPVATPTPNPAFPGTQITLSGARTGPIDVTALRCQSKSQSGDTVVEGTNNGNNVTLQLLNPAVFPSAGTLVYGQNPQGFVSFFDSGTIPRSQASPNASGWSTDTRGGVTYAATTINMNVDLSVTNSYASGTVHVSGTIACGG